MRALLLSASLALALPPLGGCDELNPPDIDPFPIPVDVSEGPLRAAATTSESDQPFPVLIDTLTPLSLVDPIVTPVDEVPRPTRSRTTLTLVAACPGGADAGACEAVPRAQFESTAVIEAHPCGDPDAACRVGLADDGGDRTAEYAGIIGGDLLAQTAVRVDLRDPGAPFAQLFPDIAGTNGELCRGGEAVISTPLSGGATLLIGGAEVIVSGTRVPLGVCLGFRPDAPGVSSGTNALLLLATGLGASVLTEGAYERYRDGTLRDEAIEDAPALADLPAATLHLPSGPTPARRAIVPRLAIVGRTDESRGQCEERRAAQIMSELGTCQDLISCPCENQRLICPAPAAVALAPADGIEVAIVPDAHPIIQALREELRPEQAEVDGLLGLTPLMGSRFAIDYPSSRMLFRCGADPSCRAITANARPRRDPREARCP